MTLTTTFKCDRCGETVPADERPATWAEVSVPADGDDAADLCANCYRELLDWLYGPKQEKRP